MIRWFKIPKAGALSFLVSGLVFSGLSIYRSQQKPNLLPVMVRAVPQGGIVTSQDFQWTRPNIQFTSWHSNERAQVNLFPGEVLSRYLLGGGPYSSKVTVAVSPASAADISVAKVGGRVNVIVVGKDSVLWQSGPVQVMKVGQTTLTGGMGDTVEVLLSSSQALAFDRVKVHGLVSLVGMSR